MELPVWLERTSGNTFRAVGSEALGLAAEGATRDEALSRLQALISERMDRGAEFVALELPAEGHPAARFAGMFRENPLFDEWQEAIRERRRRLDEEPES